METPPLLKEVAAKGLNSPPSSEQGNNHVHGASLPQGKEVYLHHLPFPNAYFKIRKRDKIKHDQDVVDLFSKIEVNIPLIKLVKQVPAYSKFLKELCTSKRKFKIDEKVQLGSSVSALFTDNMPQKSPDPGSYTIPCTISRAHISDALLHLGAAINLMPKPLYNTLGFKSMKPTRTVLQLADKTVRYPCGVVEDVLVRVRDLVFPADFVILDTSMDLNGRSNLILGRPFLDTANTIINMKERSITMSVGDHEIKYVLDNPSKHMHDVTSLYGVQTDDSMLDCENVVSSMHGFIDNIMTHPPPSDPHHSYTMDAEPNAPPVSSNPAMFGKDSPLCNVAGVSKEVPPPLSSPKKKRKRKRSKQKSPMTNTADAALLELQREVTMPVHSKLLPLFSPIFARLDVLDTPNFEDPFLSGHVEESPLKVSDFVWVQIAQSRDPDFGERARWVGPLEIKSIDYFNDKASLQLYEDHTMCCKLDRLRLYHSSYKPP